jgi:hypothetical protein
MTTLSDALARAPNPLAAHTVSDGDGGTGWVDVPALHQEARAALWQGCERARQGHSQVFALVGEAGLGKSHLLLWLRQRLALRGDPQTYFIAMPALPDLAQPFRHALRQLVGALCRRESTVAAADSSDPSSGLLDRPIDSLLWGALYTQACDLLDAARVGMYQGPATLLKLLGPMCSDAGRRRPLADFAAAAQKVWGQVEPGLRSYLLSLPTEMSIDSAARAVLLQYPYADRRGLCTAWLAGEELSQKDRERLAAKQVINNENAAKYVLCSVVRLLTAAPGAHLILHYDQTQQLVEQLGQPGLQAMAEVAAAIQGSGGSSLQVLSLRPEHLSQLQGRTTRPTTAPGPIRNLDQTVRLGQVSPELLQELIAARLDAGLAEAADRPSPLYPFTAAELAVGQWPKEADTPRAALQVFAKRYADKRRELIPGHAGSARNAVSSPGRAASGPTRAKDAPSIPGVPEQRSRSSQSPSMDFLSDEETSDALAATPVATSPIQGVRARSLTHADESGGTAAPAKLVPQRAAQGFVADSSPTIQALPKSLLVSATGKVAGRDAKAAPSFAADSSPTQRAVSDDVMGKVRGPGAASKRSPEPARDAKPVPVAASPSRAVTTASEDAVMGRVRGTAKAAEAPPPAAERPADRPVEKLADKPAAKPAEKQPERPPEKPTLRPAAPAVVKAPESEPAPATKAAANAVPHVEADSSPTLKRVPDEQLIKASRERSRPHSDAIARKAAPSSDSGVIGRPTPTMQVQPSLVRASRPSAAPAKPAVSNKPVAVTPPAKAPPVEEAAPAPAPGSLPSNVPDPLPPSSESPSMGWLAMANDQDPLADAVKQAKADLAAAPGAKPVVALSEPPRPSPNTSPTRPPNPTAPPAAPAKAPSAVSLPRPSIPPAGTATKPPLAQRAAAASSNPPASVKAPPPALAPAPAENVPTELPPSAESPSMGWLAMASGNDKLEDAVAQAKAELAPGADPAAPRSASSAAESASGKNDKGESGPNKARAARPIRGTMSLGVVVVNPTTVKPAEPPAESASPAEPVRPPVRSTQARMPAIQLRTAQSVSPQQVLAALAGRGMMEDWQLGQELGLPLDSLEKILVTLEEEGQVRLMAMGDGQRMVVLID